MPSAHTVFSYALSLGLLALVIDALRCKQILPLFGSQKIARHTWAASFLLANPLLIALYFAVPRKQWLKFKSANLRDRLMLACLIAALYCQYAPPGTSFESESYKRDGQVVEHSEGTSFSVMAITTKYSANTSEAWTMYVPSIWPRHTVITAARDTLSWRAAQAIAANFAQQPWSHTVRVRATGSPAAEGRTSTPDLYISVDASDVTELNIPLRHTFKGTVELSASSAPNHVGPFSPGDERITTSRFDTSATVEFDFTRVGVAYGPARYGDPASRIADWFDDLFVVSLEEQIQEQPNTPTIQSPLESAHVPRAPDITRDATSGFPTLVAARNNPIRTELSSGAFVHQRETFLFDDKRSALEVLTELKSEMDASNWTSTRLDEEERERSYLTGSKNGAKLTASRWPLPKWMATTSYMTTTNPDGTTTTTENSLNPLVNYPDQTESFAITIDYPFSDQELTDLATHIATTFPGDKVIAPLLLLRHSLDETAGSALIKALEANPLEDPTIWLLVAKINAQAGNLEAATKAINHSAKLDAQDPETDQKADREHLANTFNLTLG